MNRIRTNIVVDKYLSFKRIVLLSVVITMAYYFLYTLSHYFGRPSFSNQEREQVLEESKSDMKPMRFEDARSRSQERRGERFEPLPKFRTPFYKKVLLNIPLTFIMVFAVMLYCRYLFSRNFKRLSDEVATALVGSLLITFVLSSMCTLLQLYIFPDRPGPNRTVFQYVMRGYLGDCSLIAITVMTVYLVRAQYHGKVADIENETLRAESINSRYEALKNQLDPHFMFNSMNTLQSLITVDADRAEEYVQQLCTVLRYTLQKREVVTLAEELECTADYCRMLKIRYGDNLVFDHHIDHERYDNYLVPPLAIQGLVENAIKHNVISVKQPLTVHISTDDNGHLIVSNKIQPKVMEEESSGIGLANLAERYRLQWNKNVEIFDDGNNFIVTLPLVEN